MKAFLIFLSGALLGSIAAWFVWLGQVRAPEAAQNLPTEPTHVPVTQPQPKRTAPKARPAIRRDDADPAPRMIPTQAPTPGDPAPADANVPAAPVDVRQATALPPESTPIAPVGAGGTLVDAPAAALPPLRALALAMPVAGVKPSQLLDTYADARGGARSHEAIDIMAPRGTPVYAVEDGKVAKLFDSKQGGLTVYQFDRAGELAYYYAHLDRYAPDLAEGQVLKKGDLVGYVGYTGNANPQAPHLHFAIFRLGPEKKWWQGTPINPYPHLRGQ